MSTHFITLSILAVYVLFSVFWLIGRRRMGNKKKSSNHSAPVSIVIPYRNEYARITPILEILSKEIRLCKGSEVIFVDDHSEDQTVKLLASYQSAISPFLFIHLPETEAGKKAAISMGVSKASNSFIVTLDADTLPTQVGMDAMAAFAADKEVRMVCGMVVQKSAGWSGAAFADLEFLSLSGSCTSFAGLGFPFLCNGAFLGFKKEAFQEVGGYSGNREYPGGDDVFLLEKVRNKYGKKAIHYLSRYAERADTPGDGSIAEFFQRRVRWGSKSAGYGLPGKVLTGFMVLIHVSWFCLFVYHSASGNFAHILVVSAVKMIADFVMLGPLCIRFNRPELIPYIFPSSFFHPLYLAFTALASLKGTFTWKGRKYGNSLALG
jgi:cellulose synthase/poly-beta-1,6-N-acetylglucosamine synthase-like glycosyltransferase